MTILQWLPVLGWLVAPVISFFVIKLLSYPRFHLWRKLRELEQDIIPSMKQVLGDVTEQRILRGAKDEGRGSESDLKTLGKLDKDLKYALCEAEDVLDVIEYHRIEKKVVGDHNWVLRATGDWIACCKQSSFGQKLWQCAQNQNQKLRYLGGKLQQRALDLDLEFWEVVAKLQQYAQNLKEMLRDLALGVGGMLMQFVQSLNTYIHQGAARQPPMLDAPAAEFRDDVEQGTARPSSMPEVEPSNPPSPNALPSSAGSATESRGDENQHGSAEEVPMLDATTTSLSNPPTPGSATEFSGDNQHGSAEEAPMLDADAATNSLVQIVWDCFGFVFAHLCSFCLTVGGLPSWSWEQFGIKIDDDTATDCVLSINEIFSLRKRIKNIEYIVSESKKSPLLNQDSSSSSSVTVKESSSEQKEIDKLYRSIEQKVFGRDKDCADICRMLREGPGTYAASSSSSNPSSVIVIYGITGSGKSTLARYVCDYEKRAKHFNPIMFIHVGRAFRVVDIFRDMLDQIKQQRPSDTEDPKSLKTELKDLDSLKAELKEELKDKCFLLVLDDLWFKGNNTEERLILLDVLGAGQSGSRILVTAQKKDAAAGLGAQKQIQIPDLEEKQYLSMFMHYAQVSQVTNPDYEKYEAIGRKILKKLGTSPIAARTVAARLQCNNSIDDWQRTANDDVLNETMGALWWSYQKLGVDIRRCFAYSSIFPRGYELNRDDLVRIWIAQGFVNTRSETTEELEDVGQRYFDELLTFSFIQADRKDHFVIFTIHDLLHELAERVSGTDEFSRIGLNGSPEDIPRGVHHLFIKTNNIADVAEKILDLGNLRTLIINEDFDPQHVERNHDLENVLGRLFKKSTKLRVLIITLQYSGHELSIPVSIYRMKHLRYLCFGHFVVPLILPSTFSKLYHIQFLNLSTGNVSYPEDMANLICLRHISAWSSFPNIEKLVSLQSLLIFTVKEAQGFELKQLERLNKLRGSLHIHGLEIVGSKEEALQAHLNHKEQLRKLQLSFGQDMMFDPDVETRVLEGLCPPEDLQELYIRDYRGSWYPSWMLLSRDHSEIAPKHLHKLRLSSCSQLLPCIPEGSELFIGLRELEICSCDWDRLPENMERLVSLQKLEIWLCHNIELLPKLPVQSLKEIVIQCCFVLSRTCKEEGHENWRKIQEIPEIEID